MALFIYEEKTDIFRVDSRALYIVFKMKVR